jgi:hypothetical protein
VKEHIIAVDVAKKRDYYNIMVGKVVSTILEGVPVLGRPDRFIHTLDIVHIEKYQGLTYDDAAAKVLRITKHRDLVDNYELLVDGTGVGEAAVESIRKLGLHPIPIVFTAGGAVREISAPFGALFAQSQATALSKLSVIKEIHVPKNDLVAAGALLAQQRRFGVPKALRWHDDFLRQMSNFVGKVNEITRRIKFENLDDAIHDDQVVCYLMLAWWMERMTASIKQPEGAVGTAEITAQSGRPYKEGKNGQA